jgi:hypothetical protein
LELQERAAIHSHGPQLSTREVARHRPKRRAGEHPFCKRRAAMHRIDWQLSTLAILIPFVTSWPLRVGTVSLSSTVARVSYLSFRALRLRGGASFW